MSGLDRIEKKLKQFDKWLPPEKRKSDRPRTPIEQRCPEWALPLLKPARYKGVHGGRGGGKSHFMAEMLIERCIDNPDLRVVCIREIQKSLKFSAKLLIEEKIEELGYGDRFEIFQSEIRRRNRKGLIIFQGMQDHTADSIKSLEGFEIAWVEEAQNLSRRSLRLLRPTIRREGSEIWFSWNPENESDPVDEFLRSQKPKDSIVCQTTDAARR
jgi:phage terminase large subunit